MRRFALRRSIHAVLITAVAMTAAWPASAADTITVGSVTATGNTVQVPVYLRDASGSPLGSDKGAGNRIQFLSFEVEYPPTSGFSSFVTLERTGVLQGLTAMIEDTMSILGKIRYSGVFNESTQPIPFTLNAAPPGNEIAMLTFTLNEFATPNSTIPLTLNPAETFLKNQFGSVLVTPGPDLILVNGSITIPPIDITLQPGEQTILKGTSSDVTVRTSSAMPTNRQITLTSSNPGIVRVPAGVVIQQGSNYAIFSASGIEVGGPVTITATLPASLGGTHGSASASVIQESPPVAPSAPEPADASTAVPAAVTLRWSAGGNYRYSVFFGPAPSPALYTVTSNNSFYVPTFEGTKYYWRVEASNLAGTASSPEWSFTTLKTTQCKTPPGPTLTAPDTAGSGKAFQLSWTAVSDATEYQIDESASSAFATPQTTTLPALQTTYSLTRIVSADTTFYFRVRGYNGGDCKLTGTNSSVKEVLVQPPAIPEPRIIPVLGSVQGNGALFRTAVQLMNPTDAAISGKIVFHKAGVPGNDSDPSLNYALGPHEGVSYSDLLPVLEQSGIGSADVIVTQGVHPLSVIRIYATGDFAGTAGMTEDSIGFGDALRTGDTGILVAPPYTSAFRFNIGIRTLSSGASMAITVRSRFGIVTNTLLKSFPATYFSQTDSTEFLGVPLEPTDSIHFAITAGSAIVYGAATDNASQDPSIQFAKRLAGSAN